MSGRLPSLDTPRVPPARPCGPVRLFLDVFSSIWTGVFLLALLFVYCSVGSAIPPLRQVPALEMTEFEWFHWWPFKALVAAVCLTVVTATLRRIPFRPVNYGVWTIHAGVLVLAAGSVRYFSTKVEGDAPVARRQVRIQVEGEPPRTMPAMQGNTLRVGGYELGIVSIDPQWEILSGEDQGRRAYSVNVMVRSPQRTFVRQLLAGYPQYTEDLVESTEPGPPWTRARKALGTPLVDEDLELSLEHAPQPWFYLSNEIAKHWALYLREAPEGGPPGPWVQRPIEGLPLYNDRVADPREVWAGHAIPARPIRVPVPPADPADPLPDVTVEAVGYLRYARMHTARAYDGGGSFDPAVHVLMEDGTGRSEEYELAALDPAVRSASQGRMVFEWADTEEAYRALLQAWQPKLRIVVPGTGVEVESAIDVAALSHRDEALPFATVGSTGFSYRVRALHDGLVLPGTQEVISVAVVEVRGPDRSYVRWVCDDPTRTRDFPDGGDVSAAHGQPLPLDDRIVMGYTPRRALLVIAGGPGEGDLRLIHAAPDGPREHVLPVGRTVALGADVRLTVLRYDPRSRLDPRPFVVPPERREREAAARLAMVKVELPGDAGPQTHWLPFHHWVADDASQAIGHVALEPTPVTLPGGRRVEILFSRTRRPLPAPVVLDDFEMTTHVGGFTGDTLSVLNWTSRVRFQTDGGWSEPLPVSVNHPREFGGLSYFQAQWDPPRAAQGYGGLSYTVLGVGNRLGVNVMLLGCCMTVLGMIYAFYVKPLIKRRRMQAAAALAAAAARDGQASPRPPSPRRATVGAADGERRP